MSKSTYLETAVSAALAAGEFLRSHFGSVLEVNEFAAHDIKLELDVRSQELITRLLLERFPDHAIYGEEGIAGNQQSDFQWIVDPKDGRKLFQIEHETRSMKHRLFNRQLVNRNHSVTNMTYQAGQDAFRGTY